MRIISLVPSITETLFDFGLTNIEIVGRTKFCIHPKNKVEKVAQIGGTKNIDVEKIKAINPDLIIANKEENVKDQVEELMPYFPVWLTEIDTLEDNTQFLKELGKRLDKSEIANKWIEKVKDAFPQKTLNKDLSYSYLIWKKPYMTIGHDTFIHHILERLGLKNTHIHQSRYPMIEISDMENSDFILLSTEPYPFQEKHKVELLEQLPNKKIIIVDGEAFSWYGTHLAKCKRYYQDLILQIEVLK